jgi:hypothetical protein
LYGAVDGVIDKILPQSIEHFIRIEGRRPIAPFYPVLAEQLQGQNKGIHRRL